MLYIIPGDLRASSSPSPGPVGLLYTLCKDRYWIKGFTENTRKKAGGGGEREGGGEGKRRGEKLECEVFRREGKRRCKGGGKCEKMEKEVGRRRGGKRGDWKGGVGE